MDLQIKELQHEFDMAFKLIKQVIDKMNSEKWGESNLSWSYAFRLFHIIETIDFYLNDEPDGFIFGGFVGIDKKKLSKEEYIETLGKITNKTMNDYLDEVKLKSSKFLEAKTIKEIIDTDKFAEWGFLSRRHKISYALMHTFFHAGELAHYLRENNYDHITW